MLLLLIIIFAILIISYYSNGKELAAPSFLFCISFVFCAGWGVAYAERWSTELRTDTLGLITGCVCWFVVVSLFVRTLGKRYVWGDRNINEASRIEIHNFKLYIFLLFELLSILFYIKAVRDTTGQNNLRMAIYTFRNASLYSDKLYSIPRYINIMLSGVIASGYWFAYIISRNIVFKHKNSLLLYILFVNSVLASLLLGSRNVAINIILSFLGVYLVLRFRKLGTPRVLTIKQWIIIGGILVFVLATFQSLGHLLGRTKVWNPFDLLAIYCGASIHNLNYYIENLLAAADRSIWGSQTFINIIGTIRKYLGFSDYKYFFNTKHVYANGYQLGNVGTIFWSWIYDFGKLGCFFMTTFMAVFSELLYIRVKTIKNKDCPSLAFLLYGYLFNTYIFAYFSDWFCEELFSTNLVYYILYWIVFNLFFCNTFWRYKIKIRFR